MLSETKDLIKSINDNSDYYDENYMKITFNSDDNLPLQKYTKLHGIMIVVGSVFHKGNKYYSQIFLNDCLFILAV